MFTAVYSYCVMYFVNTSSLKYGSFSRTKAERVTDWVHLQVDFWLCITIYRSQNIFDFSLLVLSTLFLYLRHKKEWDTKNLIYAWCEKMVWGLVFHCLYHSKSFKRHFAILNWGLDATRSNEDRPRIGKVLSWTVAEDFCKFVINFKFHDVVDKPFVTLD